MKKNQKIILIAIIITALLWLTLGIIDFNRVTRKLEKPIFCILMNGADDGGSGKYVGLGYSFDIKGNFMSLDELPGVTNFKAKILGITVSQGIRD